ncbi:laminin subunit gamma-3 [Grus japonensis]|uniref:Laminin subunit gamma-3 n=1 Tax=Grus japonensis TaxID=30415 RepID=A0ABC9XLQ4_GRUJA
MVVSPLLAVAGRGGQLEQGDAGSRAGQGTGISALVQAVLPIRWPGKGDGVVGPSPGKAYEITYVRLKFHTSRPESFAIYKRSRAEGPWVPFQSCSASCEKTYRKRQRHYLRLGEDEQVAFCTDEFSDISPLSGSNVTFSTLEGQPSAYNFDGSPTLQEWVTVTDLLISLNWLNTFGDDIFKDPKVLQLYYYAISDFSVGGRCKCNGHASECAPDEAGQLVCMCQHNTTGTDCERCQPFYQDRPWARGTAKAANECLPCNCSGRSDECFYNRELYRRSGHGGHCRDNAAGPHCKRCRQNHYRWEQRAACHPCHCHSAANVTGWKCERCKDGYHSLSEGGCRPCACDPVGSVGTCNPNTGHCTCKERVEGHLCDRCQLGWFNLHPHNPAGCTSCFCSGRSTACMAADGYEVTHIRSDFSQGLEGWAAAGLGTTDLPLHWAGGEIVTEWDGEEPVDFLAPGHCQCLHNTEGPSCERCSPGFYGNPFTGRFDDCKPCLCPGCSPCTEVPGSREVVCTHCPRDRECHGNVDLNAMGNCDPVSGRRLRCLYNTTGEHCEMCRPGFYGDALAANPAGKCAPCNCSPLGSVTPQCRKNSTCLCCSGFVGYKCNWCQANFFPDPPSSRCQRCPACYGLVMDKADQMKARLQEMEEWLQKTGCNAHPGRSPMLGDVSWGEGLPGPHLLQGAQATLSVQVGWLAGALGTARGCLSNASQATGCSNHGPPKTCVLLSEIGAVLQSVQQEILHAADTLATMGSHQPWAPREAGGHPGGQWDVQDWWGGMCPAPWVSGKAQGPCGHEDAAAQVEAVVGRALHASSAGSELLQSLLEGNATQDVQRELEAGYEEVQRVREELGAGMAEMQQANADMAKKLLQVAALGQVSSDQAKAPACTPTPCFTRWAALPPELGDALMEPLASLTPQQALPAQAGALAQDLAALEQAAEAQEPSAQQAIEASRALAAELCQELQRTRSFEQRAQAVLQESKQARKHASQLATRANESLRELSRQKCVAEKLREDLEEAHQVGTEMSEMAKSLQEARGSLISDITTLNTLLSSLGNLEQATQVEAVLSAGRLQLERLWLRLAAPDALASQLSLPRQEAARQQEKIQAFESDLAEIRADKQNLEDILRSLPEGCSKW